MNLLYANICSIVLLAFCAQANADAGESSVTPTDEIKLDSVVVAEGFVTALPNRFVILRKNGKYCAVIFNQFKRLNDRKKATRLYSGVENTFAEYDWFYQPDGDGDFSKSNVTSGHDKLHRGPSIGFGFDIILWRSLDKRWLDCGNFNPSWEYPTTITFTQYVGNSLERDYDLEIAPTDWSELSDIDLNNPKLLWFKANSTPYRRPEKTIPKDQLPSSNQ